MNKPESKNTLSQQGKARKQAMLGQLQTEFASVHHTRLQRAALANWVAFAAVVVVIAGFGWSLRTPNRDLENQIVDAATNTTAPQPLVTAVGNVAGVSERYIVVNNDKLTAMETIADDELLTMLTNAGKPAVLGTINGELRVIPERSTRRPRREQGKTL